MESTTNDTSLDVWSFLRNTCDVFKAATCLPSEWLFTLLCKEPRYAKDLKTLKKYAIVYQNESVHSDGTNNQNLFDRINKLDNFYNNSSSQPFYSFINYPLNRKTCVEHINWELFRVQPVRFMMNESFTTQCILAVCTLTHFYTSQYGKIIMGKYLTPSLPSLHLTPLPVKDLVKVSPLPFKLSWIFYLNVSNLGYMYGWIHDKGYKTPKLDS